MKADIYSSDYYLGKLVGEIIYLRYLPTLNVDSLQSNNVINVSEEEKRKADYLHDILTATYSDGTKPKTKYGIKESTEVAHKKWINYVYTLGEKYLPKKLHCKFEKIKVLNIKEFKEGIEDYLWDTDLSWYIVDEDFWVDTHEHSWYSEVILTREK